MQLTAPVISGAVIALFVVGAASTHWAETYAWAVSVQREFQSIMARELRVIQGGDPIAVVSLCTATFAYGFVHAFGPSHGKIILGAAALASRTSLNKMAGLAAISAHAQAVTAIVTVLLLDGGLSVLTSVTASDVAERWLTPLSYGAFVLIGSLIFWRGLRIVAQTTTSPTLTPRRSNHRSLPNADQIETLKDWRDCAAVVASVAVRPFTGALFLLVFAARFDMLTVGIIATLAMGFGTATFNALVAISGVLARRLVHSHKTQTFRFATGLLHLAAGTMVVSLAYFFFALSFNSEWGRSVT